MKKLMHNVEILIVTTGKGNWRSAADAVAKARQLLDEIDRDLQSRMKADVEERRRTLDRTASAD
jgi:hypothetical protein